MANGVTSSNERTMLKALQALMGNGDMPMEVAMAAIDRVADAGLLFREPAEKEEKPAKAVKSAEKDPKAPSDEPIKLA